jgi:hypothetical protein
MSPVRTRITLRAMLALVAVAATALAVLAPRSSPHLQSYEEAVEIAAAVVMEQDASFRPERHRAKIYRECSLSPLRVDFYSDTGEYVVKRLSFRDGSILGPSTYDESDRVKSSRDGMGMYLLDRTGRVVALAPYVFSDAGEVCGLDVENAQLTNSARR